MPDWTASLRLYGPLVLRTAFRLLHHDADAADCFQRAFVSAVAVAGSGQVQNWPGLLKRLTTARALEQLRARYRKVGREQPIPSVPTADDKAVDPLETASASELAGALRTALAEIEPNLAEIFCLVCLEGMSNADAAMQMGLTANHAGVLLYRARQTLREKLQQFAPDIESRAT